MVAVHSSALSGVARNPALPESDMAAVLDAAGVGA